MPMMDPISLENQQRQTIGMPALGGIELEQGQARSASDQQRQQFQQQTDQILADRDEQARQVAMAYRRAGLASLASELEQANRRAGFNAARRGVLGGSADIEARGRNQEAAQAGAAQVSNQADDVYNQTRLSDFTQIFPLQQMIAQGDPFMRASQQTQIGRESDLTKIMLGQFDLEQNARNIDRGYSTGIGQALGGLASAAGTATYGALTQRRY